MMDVLQPHKIIHPQLFSTVIKPIGVHVDSIPPIMEGGTLDVHADPYQQAMEYAKQFGQPINHTYFREESVNPSLDKIKGKMQAAMREFNHSEDLVHALSRTKRSLPVTVEDGRAHIHALNDVINNIHSGYQKQYGELVKSSTKFMQEINTAIGNSNNLIAANIHSVQPSGVTSQLPLNSEKNIKIETPEMSREELHSFNTQKQAEIITGLLNQVGSNITTDKVENVLNYNGMGCLTQQSLNYRTKSNLIILTLLEPHERTDELLNSAAKLIESFNKGVNDNEKHIIKHSLKTFDEKIGHLLSSVLTTEKGIFLTIKERFESKYIQPALGNLLKQYLSLDMIEGLKMDKCLTSLEYKQKQEEISVLDNAYQGVSKDSSVDENCHIYNMFSKLEEMLEIVKTLKVQVNWEDRAVQPSIGNSPLQAASGDEVDGPMASAQPNMPTQAPLSPQSAISNSFNTTNIFNISSSLSENITGVRNQETKANETPSAEKQNREHSKVEMASFRSENRTIARMKTELALGEPPQEPPVDYDTVEPEIQQPLDKGNPAVVNQFSGKKPLAVDDKITRADVLTASRPINEKLKHNQESQQQNINAFLPKNGHLLGSYLRNDATQKNGNSQQTAENAFLPKNSAHTGSYLKDGKVPDKVTLSAEGALTRNQSDNDIYRGVRQAPKAVDDTASYLPNKDAPVTLTERGALTRDQSVKNAYTTKP